MYRSYLSPPSAPSSLSRFFIRGTPRLLTHPRTLPDTVFPIILFAFPFGPLIFSPTTTPRTPAPSSTMFFSPPTASGRPLRSSCGGLCFLLPHFPTLQIPPLLKRLLFLDFLQASLSSCFLDEFLLPILLGKDVGHGEMEGRLGF